MLPSRDMLMASPIINIWDEVRSHRRAHHRCLTLRLTPHSRLTFL